MVCKVFHSSDNQSSLSSLQSLCSSKLSSSSPSCLLFSLVHRTQKPCSAVVPTKTITVHNNSQFPIHNHNPTYHKPSPAIITVHTSNNQKHHLVHNSTPRLSSPQFEVVPNASCSRRHLNSSKDPNQSPVVRTEYTNTTITADTTAPPLPQIRCSRAPAVTAEPNFGISSAQLTPSSSPTQIHHKRRRCRLSQQSPARSGAFNLGPVLSS